MLCLEYLCIKKLGPGGKKMAETPSPLEKSYYKLKKINIEYLIAIILVRLVLRQLKPRPPPPNFIITKFINFCDV